MLSRDSPAGTIFTIFWYEQHDSMESAISKEKRLKNWKRIWKIKLVEDTNSHWHDLYNTIL